MNVVTGSRATHDRDDRPSGPAVGDARRDSVGPPRAGAVAPHPRPEASPAAPAADDPSAGPPVEVEPTTGAPVDAVPRRVPVRQPNGGRRRRGPLCDGGTADDEFWAPIEEVHWDGTPIRPDPAPDRDRPTGDAGSRTRRPDRTPRPPDPPRGLAVLLGLSLAAAFFAWVSAGPFWVALGHATPGTVVVVDCAGDGLGQRCRGIFTAAEGRYVAHGVRVSGVPAGRTAPGSTLAARMTGPDGGTAYADHGVGAHLRWLLGLLAVAGCAAGTARWTGATRLADPRQRRWAVAAAAAGPALITAGFLVAAW